MIFYKAIEVDHKPFIRWCGWAHSQAELAELGEFDNPLIVAEDQIPPYQFGVCTWKVEGGELVSRTQAEMDAFEGEYLSRQAITAQVGQSHDVADGTFQYDGRSFPMNQTARLLYSAIRELRGNTKIMDALGDEYSLTETKIDAFMLAFFTQLKILTQPQF